MFLWFNDNNNHSIRRANTAQALAWWRHLWALHGATDMLHRLMCLVSYEPGGMVVAFVIDSYTFFSS
jgi:hypothetical protein